MYRAEIISARDEPFKVLSGNHEFNIDTKGRGITPPDTLLASLASCVGVYIRKYCEGSGLALDNFTVTAEAEFCQEKPVGFKEINVSIDFKGASLDERRSKAILDFVKNCPVHNTLHLNPAVGIKII